MVLSVIFGLAMVFCTIIYNETGVIAALLVIVFFAYYSARARKK